MFQFTDVSEFKTTVNSVIEENGTVIQLKGDVSELKQDVSELKQDVSELKQDVSELKQDVREIRVLFDQQQINSERLLDGIGYLLNASKKMDHHSEQIETLSDKSEGVRVGLKTHVNDQKVHLSEN